MIQCQIECVRGNVTPREFFTYCKRQAEKKGLDIEDQLSFDEWANPSVIEYRHKFNEDGSPLRAEMYASTPYNYQIFSEGIFNFILEFDFDTSSKGHGYMMWVLTDKGYRA